MDHNTKQGQDAQQQDNTGAQPGTPGQGQQQGGGQPGRDQAEGSREQVRGNTERGDGSQGERNRAGEGGGISNRGPDREMSEQQDLPPRGQSRDEADTDSTSGSPDAER